MQVELIFEKTCPNIESARQQLRIACLKLGIEPDWQEWDVADSSTPAYAHGYGSPTILVNGRDVSEMKTAGHDYCCRIYQDNAGNHSGVPNLDSILTAMQIQAE